ncbi:putative signal peptidase complex subunit 2 [Dorcoceras hygrometricum]|uniref:Putative signal peptidase complex subunit 2 n=1 Tax=Dorcoceras hygrometricum TaxID=472368 RepID=A0A2Z7D2X8_9LAMI|nr:putative signal peptidase complex subunit 2 [Dorcoceras hygrometricum]
MIRNPLDLCCVCRVFNRLLPESSGFLTVLIVAQYKVYTLVFQHVAYTHGRAAIPHSHLPAGIVATMRRVVNYHSSWARKQQVELFDASGNPGSTAGRGFNPAGGAPVGG